MTGISRICAGLEAEAFEGEWNADFHDDQDGK